MYVRSIYPPVPPLEDKNAHYTILRRPDQAEWPNYTLYIDIVTGKKLMFYEFLERIHHGATYLGTPLSGGGLGINPDNGDIVGILSDNCIDFSTLIHALLTIKTPFSLLSSHSTAFELNHTLRTSEVTRLFVSPRLLPLALKAASEVGISGRNIYILGGHVEGRQNFDDMIDYVRNNRLPRLPVLHATKDTLAYLIFSSGTTGLPKAVMISHGNLSYSLRQSLVVGEEWYKAHTPSIPNTPEGIPVTLAFLPMYHSYGLHNYAIRAFQTRSTYVLLPKWGIETALNAIPKYHITNFPMIPSVIHQLVTYLENHQADLSTLVVVGSGAAYLPPQLADKLTSLVPKTTVFFVGYGMSEVTISATITALPGVLGGRYKPVPGSVGILSPGMEARILRDDGSEAAWNEPGHLYLKGANVAMGYWKNSKATQETFIDGWLRTGDMFHVDKDGNFFFDNRAKDTLKVSGMQVSPTEIEEVLLMQPDNLIIDVTVAGVSGGRLSDEKVPRVWIVLSDSGKKRRTDEVVKTLEGWCRKNLSRYKWPKGGIEIVDEIPKSPVGKVLRRVLQERYEESVPQPMGKL